mgnify:CR=1 FL=1
MKNVIVGNVDEVRVGRRNRIDDDGVPGSPHTGVGTSIAVESRQSELLVAVEGRRWVPCKSVRGQADMWVVILVIELIGSDIPHIK